ncbi:MAG: hypothetical protein CCU26_10770 [Nitrospira sp. UW-LDO-01]|nr:MAG: hypothetical protein CCU26_10770 [Nitrospira sp. UW-LDO-01]
MKPKFTQYTSTVPVLPKDLDFLTEVQLRACQMRIFYLEEGIETKRVGMELHIETRTSRP